MSGAAERWLPPALADTAGGETPAALPLAAARRLAREGAASLRQVGDATLAAAFLGAVAAFRDPSSQERRRLDPALLRATALSQGCLDASLEALLEGFGRAEVETVLARAATTRPRAVRVPGERPTGDARPGPHLVVLAASLPGLALQPLLSTLALRRPALLKSSTGEPCFAPAFAAALAARAPVLGEGVAALCWPGGDPAVEEPLLAVVDRVVAYGGAATLADLRRRVGGRLIGFGPKASVAVVGALEDEALEPVAAGLARDVALFDQRGCLSLQAVYTTVADAGRLARALASALERDAARWPPAPLDRASAAALRLVREEADFLGGEVAPLALETATVIVDRRALFLPSPGHRTVRIHPLPRLEAALTILRPHGPRLQGAALAGDDALELAPELETLGVSRLCAPGELQSPGASWCNGGVDLVAALAETDT